MAADTNIKRLFYTGKVVRRSSLPECQAKEGCKNKGRFDCKSWDGRWGFTCETHWATFAAQPGTLGTGIGQYLILFSETDLDLPDWVR